MKKTFKSDSISCSSCANLIKNSLEETYGEISINLEITPKEVTVEILNDEQEKKFKNDMNDLGFEIVKK